MTRGAAYLLVLVVTVELAVAECFLSAARPWGHPLPVAAALAAVANPLLGYAGGRVLGRVSGAVWPFLLWMAVVLWLSAQRAEGDVLVAATARGWSLIAVGAIGLVIGGVLGTTPGAPSSR